MHQNGMNNNFSLLANMVKKYGSIDIVREYSFRPGRKWRFDYAIPSHKVAIEVEGYFWSEKGKHTSQEGYLSDMEKYNEAAAQGWKLIRVIPSELLTYKTIRMILRACSMI